MSRKVKRVPYHLDAQDVKDLPPEEIAVILRGTDDLIMSGGRNLLTKILNGSRDKKLLSLGLNKSPVYGHYNHLTLAKIQARVAWIILRGYLVIAYDWSLPLLRYTQREWEIERETYAKELLNRFDDLLATGPTEFDMFYLKDRASDMILILLDMVEESNDPKYIPLFGSLGRSGLQKGKTTDSSSD